MWDATMWGVRPCWLWDILVMDSTSHMAPIPQALLRGVATTRPMAVWRLRLISVWWPMRCLMIWPISIRLTSINIPSPPMSLALSICSTMPRVWVSPVWHRLVRARTRTSGAMTACSMRCSTVSLDLAASLSRRLAIMPLARRGSANIRVNPLWGLSCHVAVGR